MPTLAETQALFRNAVVTGDVAGVAPLLEVSREKRLAIHRRNYQSSLVHALLGKFPAVAWLTGTPFVTEAAASLCRAIPAREALYCGVWRDVPAILVDAARLRPNALS